MADTVVVTAATSPLGRRVCQRVAADPEVERVIAIDRPGSAPDEAWSVSRGAGGAGAGATVEHHAIDLGAGPVAALLEGVAAVIHVGSGEPAPPRRAWRTAASVADGAAPAVAGARALLAAVSRAGVPTLVIVSSAMVYGAWPGNPVPLTEEAPLRPVPGLPSVVARAEVERLAAAWRSGERGGLGPTLALLRPVTTVGPDQPPWPGRSPWSAAGLSVDDEPPVQYVHLDDVASAVDLARRQRLDGPFNVAPDGWLPGAERRRLAGAAPRVPVPAAVAERAGALRWKLGLTGAPPSMLPYTMYPWVVANDRLRAAGWHPAHSNAEALVDADPGGLLGRVQPRHRQLLSLLALAAPALGALAAGALGLRRALRVRPRRSSSDRTVSPTRPDGSGRGR